MAAPVSSGVLTLSSACGSGGASSGAPDLIRNLRGQLRPPATKARAPRRAGRLVDRAQRLRQAVVGAAEGRRDRAAGSRWASRCRAWPSSRNGRSQASTSHAASGCAACAARCRRSGPMPASLVDDLREARARSGSCGLVRRARTRRRARPMPRSSSHGALELRPAVVLERGLVAPMRVLAPPASTQPVAAVRESRSSRGPAPEVALAAASSQQPHARRSRCRATAPCTCRRS